MLSASIKSEIPQLVIVLWSVLQIVIEAKDMTQSHRAEKGGRRIKSIPTRIGSDGRGGVDVTERIRLRAYLIWEAEAARKTDTRITGLRRNVRSCTGTILSKATTPPTSRSFGKLLASTPTRFS